MYWLVLTQVALMAASLICLFIAKLKRQVVDRMIDKCRQACFDQDTSINEVVDVISNSVKSASKVVGGTAFCCTKYRHGSDWFLSVRSLIIG